MLLACSTVSLAAQTNSSSLQGKVIAPDGTQPLNSVRVKLVFNGRPIQETFTDLSGRFHFTALAPGTYQLIAEGDGKTFQTTTIYAEILRSGGGLGSSAQADIQLRPVPGRPLPQPGVISGFSQNVPKAAQEAFDRANKLIEQSNAAGAVAQLQEAVKIFPEYFEAHLQLGNLFLKEGRLDQALVELDKAREVNSNDERPYQSFGLLLMQQKNFPVAVAVFAEAERQNPTNPMNPVMVATALIHQASTLAETAADERRKLLERAEAEVSQASRLGGDKVKPDAITLASFYEMKNEPGRAADELEQYVRKSQPRNAEQIEIEIKRLRAKSKTSKSLPQ